MTTTTLLTLPVAKHESLFKRVITNPSGIFSLGIIVAIVLFGIFVPIFSPFNATDPDVYHIQAAPDALHWFGTDSAGRDIFTRLALATNMSLETALLAVVIAIVLGVSSGLIAGYFGGWFDSFSNWMTSILMALPGLVVLLAAASVLGPSMWTSMTIFGILLSPAYFRMVYVTVRAVKNELFVDAARVSGLSDLRIIARHILGVVRTPIIIQTAIIGSIAIAIQAGLEFLGLGDTANPSWGSMLNDAFSRIYVNPLLLVWPSTIIALITLSLVVFANTLRDELERTGPKRMRVKKGREKSDAQLANDAAAVATIYHEAPERAKGEQILKVTNVAIGYPDGTGGLRQALDDQHPGHHRILREVPLEERLVDGDVLEADAALVAVHVVDAVEHQERVAVRQQLEDAVDVEHRGGHGLVFSSARMRSRRPARTSRPVWPASAGSRRSCPTGAPAGRRR